MAGVGVAVGPAGRGAGAPCIGRVANGVSGRAPGIGRVASGLGAAPCGVSDPPLRMPVGRVGAVENDLDGGFGGSGGGSGAGCGSAPSVDLGSGPIRIRPWDGKRPQGLERVNGLLSQSGGCIGDLQRRSVGAAQL